MNKYNMAGQLCPVHGQAFKLIKAGVSKKTGKAYSAFWACPEMGCREKPEDGVNSQEEVRPLATASPAMVVPPYKRSPLLEKTESQEKPDWDAIAEGKVRHGVVCSLIEAGRTKAEILVQAPFWVDYIMNGTVPTPATKDEINVDEIPF